MSNAGEGKRQNKLQAIPLGERLVLLSIADDDETAGAFDAGGNEGALSVAERAVAELAASGLTTTEIAQIRLVARRTISNQLAVVYRKLGVSGRRELRAWFRKRQSGSDEKAP